MSTTHASAKPPAPQDAAANEEQLPGQLSHRQILTILTGLLLGMFLAALDQSIVSTAIRVISDDLNGYSMQAWATTAYLITSTISTPLYGKLSDIFGRKPLYMISIGIFVVGSLLCSFSTSMWELAGFRALQGLGAGGLMSLAFTIIGDILPPRERSKYQGYFMAVFGTSSVLGPVLGGLLSGQNRIWFCSGWRWVFLINVPIGIIAMFVVFGVLNFKHTKRVGVRIDYLGALTLCLGLVPLLTVAEQGRDWGWNSANAWICYAVGVIGLILFVVTEWRMREDAILPLRIFKVWSFTHGVIIAFIVGAALFGGMSLIPQYFQVVHGVSATKGGLMMLPMVAGLMLMSLVAAQVIARTGHYKIITVFGSIALTAGMLLMYFVRWDTALWIVMLYTAVIGIGLGGLMQPLVLALQNALPMKDMAVSTASATFFRQIGATLGVAIFLTVLFSQINHKIPEKMAEAAQTSTFQSEIKTEAVTGNTINKEYARAIASRDTARLQSVMKDSSVVQQLNPTFARPIKEAFTKSINDVFVVITGLGVLIVILTVLWKEVPLRQALTSDDLGKAADPTAPAGAAPDPDGAHVGEQTAAVDALAPTAPLAHSVLSEPAAPHRNFMALRPDTDTHPTNPPVTGAHPPAQEPSGVSMSEPRQSTGDAVTAQLLAELTRLRQSYDSLATNLQSMKRENDTIAVELARMQMGQGPGPVARGPQFHIVKRIDGTNARTGVLVTAHGELNTPAFMPIAANGLVPGVLPSTLKALGTQAIIGDATTLQQQPGLEVLAAAGGLGAFMNWDGPTVVASIDGDATANLTPEALVQIERQTGADILVLSDPEVARAEQYDHMQSAVAGSTRFITRAVDEYNRLVRTRPGPAQSLWGVIGGGAFTELRQKAAADITGFSTADKARGGRGLDGYVIASGFGAGQLGELLRTLQPHLPVDAIKHVSGIADPIDIFAAVDAGFDTFDSPAPSTAADLGIIFTAEGPLNLTDAQYARDFTPLPAMEDGSQYTRAYMHHLYAVNKPLAVNLVTTFNEAQLIRLVERIRVAITDGTYLENHEQWIEHPFTDSVLERVTNDDKHEQTTAHDDHNKRADEWTGIPAQQLNGAVNSYSPYATPTQQGGDQPGSHAATQTQAPRPAPSQADAHWASTDSGVSAQGYQAQFASTPLRMNGTTNGGNVNGGNSVNGNNGYGH